MVSNSNAANRAQPSFGARVKGWLTFGISKPRVRLRSADLKPPLSLQELKQVSDILRGEESLKSKFFVREGCLVRHNAEKEIVVVGDLHGNNLRVERLVDEYGPDLAAGKVSLIFNGDLIHPEKKGQTDRMDTSYQVLTMVLRLKLIYPEQVHFHLGNHDVLVSPAMRQSGRLEKIIDLVLDQTSPLTSPEDFIALVVNQQLLNLVEDETLLIMKDGDNFPQGFEFLRFVINNLQSQGLSRAQIRDKLVAYQRIFTSLPVASIVEGKSYGAYIAHSPVVRGGVSQAQLVTARKDNYLMRQLLSDRYDHHYDDPSIQALPNNRSYNGLDVAATRRAIGLKVGPAKTFIVGSHEPFSESYIYMPSDNYYIVHGNVEGSFGVISLVDGLPRPVDLTTPQILAMS